MPFAASVAAAIAIATASYCVTNGAHVNRAHAATDTHDEVSDPASERAERARLPCPRGRQLAARRNKSEQELKLLARPERSPELAAIRRPGRAFYTGIYTRICVKRTHIHTRVLTYIFMFASIDTYI